MDQHLFELFETGADRRYTNCEKWDNCKAVFGSENVLPMWVADMDFKAPKPVLDALEAFANYGVFGYSIHDEAADRALCSWMKQRHNLAVETEHIRYTPGVVQSLLYALKAVTKAGDKVAMFTPVYGPFYRMAHTAGLEIVRCPLQITDNGYQMDLNQLEAQFKQGVGAFILCSPHNPVSRVWTPAELHALVALCNRCGVALISDEIHMDFEMPGYMHTPILNIEGAERAILLASATKTFNLAGLKHSSVIINDPDMRARFDKVTEAFGVGDPNLFGELAQKTAYLEGARWLDGLIEYVSGSSKYVSEFLSSQLPEIKMARHEGTYLIWLDMRELGLDQSALNHLLVNVAHVGFSDGTAFGAEGEGFARINLATPRSNVVEAMHRLERAVRQK